MKERYIETFGNSYVCNSPNNARLMNAFKEVCKGHGILYKTNDVLDYLQKFETKSRQSSLFDGF
jgi:hypothetical protein